MAKYNQFYYATDYYGTKAALAYSALPMLATALDYATVQVDFTVPTGTYSEFRLVRNQLGLPQTQEDGAIIYSYAGPPPASSALDTSDKSDAPLIPGRFAFYRVWVRRSDSNYWVQAGDAATLVPSSHPLTVGKTAVYSGAGRDGLSTTDVLVSSNPNMNLYMYGTHERFLDALPRVVTSASNSGVDAISPSYDSRENPSGANGNSLLSTFLSAFSFTYDEFLTYISLIYAGEDNHWLSPTSVFLGSQQLGMSQDIDSVTVPQRMLLRNAVEIYQKKGTSAGLELFIQSLTGYDCTLSDGRNLFLSHEDATFDVINWNAEWTVGMPDDPIGNWVSLSSGLRLSVESTQAVVPYDNAVGPFSTDPTYCLKVSASSSGQSFALGTVSPTTTGIPVTAGQAYSLSFYAKEGEMGEEGGPDTATTITIDWRDRNGLIVGSTSGTVTLEAADWTRFSFVNKVAPVGAVYATITFSMTQTYPIYFDLFQFEQGTTYTAYQEPRAVVITLNPSKINYITNASFESGTTGWDASANGALSTVSTSAIGPHGLKMTATGMGVLGATTSDYIPVVGNEHFTASAYLQDVNTAKKAKLTIQWFDSTHTAISSTDGAVVSMPSSSWTRTVHSAKAPLTAAFAKVSVETVRTAPSDVDSVVSGKAFLMDCVQFEQGDAATDYFDGYLTDDGNEWAGAAGASYTGNYPAKTNRLARLETELPFYLGFDTPYYIYTYQGFYLSGIS